jgi:serine/threonine-protein kinase
VATIGGAAAKIPVPEQYREIGPYRLCEVLGQGSFGTVWRAVHRPTHREVALKVLHRQLVSNPDVFRRFMAEIAVLSEIDHPNVVHIYDYGNSEGIPWFAMELVPGESLRKHLARRGVLDLPAALDIAAQVARGLAACHAVGVIHRDLSPANILLAEGRVRVSDLGVALRLAQDAASVGRSQTHVEGTILYMSPEQVRGGRISFSSDLFSLGSVLYHCLAGRPPFMARSLAETVDNLKQARFEPLRELRPDVGHEIAGFVAGLLSIHPDRRPQPASAVSKTLMQLVRLSAMQMSA